MCLYVIQLLIVCSDVHQKLIWNNHFAFFKCSPLTEVFDNYMQQDAHEFLIYLLNTIADLLQGMA